MSAAPPGLEEALRALLPGVALDGARPLGHGHIHGTWLAACRDARGRPHRYVAQRVNTAIFRDPEMLARNLERVTAHLMAVQRRRGAADPERHALCLVVSPAGRTLHRDDAGRYWRLFPYIAGSRSAQPARTRAEAARLAAPFGAFLADLADLDGDALTPVIPGFHDLRGRLAALDRAERDDPLARAAPLAGELDRARELGRRLLEEPELASDALPRRVVHNDCKLNNLLVDENSGAPLCVVDLDTVMSGHVLYDFGELVRTGASTADEDEPDPTRARFDTSVYSGLAEGFLAGARGLLEPEEVGTLWLGGPLMALENAVRFLADHLEGDRYFPALRADHNLDRGRAQLALAERLYAAAHELRAPLRKRIPGG